eukprot:11660454-Ditylum_brightwellii.AAC.1
MDDTSCHSSYVQQEIQVFGNVPIHDHKQDIQLTNKLFLVDDQALYDSSLFLSPVLKVSIYHKFHDIEEEILHSMSKFFKEFGMKLGIGPKFFKSRQ